MTFNNKIFSFSVLLIYVIAAMFSKGYHHFDEHFQIIEMANYKLGQVPLVDMPWELHHKMRPSIQPMITYFLIKGCKGIGVDSPFIVAFLLRLFSASFAVFVYFKLYQLLKPNFKNNALIGKGFLILSFLLWYLIYNGVRFSSENWSALLIAMGFITYFNRFDKVEHMSRTHFLVGLFWGLAFIFRFQTAFMVVGFFMWMVIVNKEKWTNLSLQLIGVVMAIGLGMLVDKWFYNEWVFSAWNYLGQFFVENKVITFEERPITFYFIRAINQGIAPVGIISIISVLAFIRYKFRHPISWMLIPFLLVHFAIGHKELRFLFSLLPFMPFMIMMVIRILDEKFKVLSKKGVLIFLKLSLIVNLLFVGVAMLRPADPYVNFYERMYDVVGQREVSLFYIGKNPYRRVTNIHFYRPPNLEVYPGQEYASHEKGKEAYLVIRDKDPLPPQVDKTQLVYSTFPDWMKSFNYGKWQERSGAISVYQVN